MKISYRTHPILENIVTGDVKSFSVFPEDAAMFHEYKQAIKDTFIYIAEHVRNNIVVLSRAFIDAYEKAGDRLYDSHIWSDVEDIDICIVTPWKEVSCLLVVNDTFGKVIRFSFVNFLENTFIGTGKIEINYLEKPIKKSVWGVISKNTKNQDLHLMNCILITLFIKYADVETKLLLPNKKIVDINCKYKNETNLPIKFLDSKWFTNLVKSEGFKVSGHFRLQPFKNEKDEWDKKLIWINEFQKTGYTAPARKTKVQGTHDGIPEK